MTEYEKVLAEFEAARSALREAEAKRDAIQKRLNGISLSNSFAAVEEREAAREAYRASRNAVKTLTERLRRAQKAHGRVVMRSGVPSVPRGAEDEAAP